MVDVTAASPNKETVGDLVLLEIPAESLIESALPEVQDSNPEPSIAADIMEAMMETAAPDG